MLSKRQLQLIEYNACDIVTSAGYLRDYIRDKCFKKDDDTIISHAVRIKSRAEMLMNLVDKLRDKNNGR